MNTDVAENEDEFADTEPVADRTLMRLGDHLENVEGHHGALARLLDLLEQEIDEHIGPSKAQAILGDIRHLSGEIASKLVRIGDCLGAIEREEHDYFA